VSPVSRSIFRIALFGSVVLTTGLVSAQDYPIKTIRIIAGSPGGGNDFQARQIAQAISGPLGQQVVVDNRPSVLVAELGAKAPPDGYTLVMQGASLWLNPLLQKVSYDAVRDFAPLSQISRDIFIVVVHPSLPVRSAKELIALAKARPGDINYGSGAPGTPQNLGMELFKSMAGVNVVGIPYRGTAPAITALLGGEVQIGIGDPGLVMPNAKSGKLKTLAVTSATPSTLAPGLPTVAATGLPGYELIGAAGMWFPAKTPVAIVTRVHQEIARFLNQPDVKERFLRASVEIVASSPEEFTAFIKSDTAKWSKVIKDAGIKGE